MMIRRSISIFLIAFIIFMILPEVGLLKTIPGIGEEFENIDSMNVHPITRYNNSLTSSTETLTISNGILNYTDIGNEGQSSAYDRSLGKSAFRADLRLQTPNMTRTGGTPSSEHTPIFYLRLNEGTGIIAIDEENNHNGTLVYGASYVNSTMPAPNEEQGTALYTINNGTYRRISMGDHDDFSFGEDGPFGEDEPFSFASWVKVNTTGKGSRMAYKGGPLAEWNVHISSGTLYFICYGDSPSDYIRRQVSISAYSSQWFYLVCTYDGSSTAAGLKIYLNGVSVGSTASGGEYISMTNTSTELRLGEAYDTGVSVEMDEIRLFDDEISANDVLIRYLNYAEVAKVRTVIGFENKKSTLDLTYPACALILEANSNRSNNNITVYYAFSEGTTRYEQNFFNVTTEMWLRVKFEVDILRSKFSIKTMFDNETTISNSQKTNLDISSTARSNLFSAEWLKVFYGNYFINDSKVWWALDYIKAPFDELEWVKYEVPTGVLSTSNTPFGSVFVSQGGLTTDYNLWNLTVPDFDSVRGVLTAFTNATDESDIEDLKASIWIRILGINASTGAPTNLGSITLGFLPRDLMGGGDPTMSDPRLRVATATSSSPTSGPWDFMRAFGGSGANMETNVEAGFVIYRDGEDRIIFQVSILGETYSFNSTCSGLSSEVRLQICHSLVDHTDDGGYLFSFNVRDFDLQYRWLWHGFPGLPIVNDLIGAAIGWLLYPFRIVGQAVGEAIEFAVDVALDPLKNVMDNVFEVLASLAASIWEEIIDQVSGILVKVFEILLILVKEAVELLQTITAYIWDNVVEAAFPGATEFMQRAINLIIDTVIWAEAGWNGMIYYSPLVYLLWTLWIFCFSAFEAQNGGQWVDIWVHRLAQDIAPFSVLGFEIYVPMAIPWFVISLFYGMVWF
ncbi:MAG: LamG-like jellyroll fold domain-containing protein [Candidatus Hodarchaeota archaeon]